MKVKDLKNDDLKGVRVLIPKRFEDEYQGISGKMYLEGIWQAGVWLKKDLKEDRIYPLCIDPKNVLNFTVTK